MMISEGMLTANVQTADRRCPKGAKPHLGDGSITDMVAELKAMGPGWSGDGDNVCKVGHRDQLWVSPPVEWG